MQKITDNNGKASFDAEYGDYDVTINKDGYTSVTETVQFRSNHKNFTLTIDKDKMGTVTITVTNSQGEAAQGLKVTVYDEDRVRYLDEAVTDVNGQVSGAVPNGTYKVNIYNPEDSVHYYDDTITVTKTDNKFSFTWNY